MISRCLRPVLRRTSLLDTPAPAHVKHTALALHSLLSLFPLLSVSSFCCLYVFIGLHCTLYSRCSLCCLPLFSLLCLLSLLSARCPPVHCLISALCSLLCSHALCFHCWIRSLHSPLFAHCFAAVALTLSALHSLLSLFPLLSALHSCPMIPLFDLCWSLSALSALMYFIQQWTHRQQCPGLQFRGQESIDRVVRRSSQ